jgi:hypothetical protein
MARITNQQFIDRHFLLLSIWNDGLAQLFSVLPSHIQWDVHRYYQPTRNLTDQELIAHRQAATATDPSLPHRASRGFARMKRAYVVARQAADAAGKKDTEFLRVVTPLQPVRAHAAGKRRILVHGIAKPELDTKRLARLLVEQADRDLADQQHQEAA